MGYYTTYTLSADIKWDEINDYLDSLDSSEYYLAQLDYYQDGAWGNNFGWYEHDEDMASLSKAFPDVLFVLDGQGEEAGDIWRKWYRNGEKISEWTLEFNVPDNPNWNEDFAVDHGVSYKDSI